LEQTTRTSRQSGSGEDTTKHSTVKRLKTYD
jgi:hypothetical protein